jgi:hypothetical protein
MCFGPTRKLFVGFCHAYHQALGLGIDHPLGIVRASSACDRK